MRSVWDVRQISATGAGVTWELPHPQPLSLCAGEGSRQGCAPPLPRQGEGGWGVRAVPGGRLPGHIRAKSCRAPSAHTVGTAAYGIGYAERRGKRHPRARCSASYGVIRRRCAISHHMLNWVSNRAGRSIGGSKSYGGVSRCIRPRVQRLRRPGRSSPWGRSHRQRRMIALNGPDAMVDVTLVAVSDAGQSTPVAAGQALGERAARPASASTRPI